MGPYVSSVSICLSDKSDCIMVSMNQLTLFLHGSTNDVRQFAADIIAAADLKDIDLRDKQEALNVHA